MPPSASNPEDILRRTTELFEDVFEINNPEALASLDLTNTPARWLKMMEELTTPEDFTFTTFESDHDEMILASPIPFYSLCSHHIIPFIGSAHVAYIPQGKIAGLSKLARTVQYFMKGLWVQEDLTATIADYLVNRLDPLGVAIVMRAEHLCMTIRGAQSPGTQTTTSVMRGVFADHSRQARAEFLRLVSL
jgi:GTP cyclohydrolase I